MGYLQPSEYTSFGLAPDTTDDWITVASTLMDTYCRRISILATQYTERKRLSASSQSLQLSYLPLTVVSPATNPFLQVQARYAVPRRGEPTSQVEEVWTAFSLPGTWVNVDPTTIDWLPDGSITLPSTFLGLPFNEVAVTYTGGLQTVPNALKSACALIVKNAQSTPGLNVKSNRVDTLQVQYFSDSLLDSNVKILLRPWVANRLG